jgi:hypothetical protein
VLLDCEGIETSTDTWVAPSRLVEIGQKQQAKLEVYREQNIVRITADKTTAMQVLEDFDDLRSSILNRRIEVRPDAAGSLLANKSEPGKANLLFKDDIARICNLTKTAAVINKDNVRPIFVVQSIKLILASHYRYGAPTKIAFSMQDERFTQSWRYRSSPLSRS